MKKTIPLHVIALDSDGFHILIESYIDSGEYLIVDTGASKSVIDSALCNRIQHKIIPIEKIETSELTGMINGEIISLSSIKLGKIIFNDFQALSMSLDHVNTIYERFVEKPIGGLLGSDFLMKHNAYINYKKRTITFEIE